MLMIPWFFFLESPCVLYRLLFSCRFFFQNVICFNLNLINRKGHAKKLKSLVLSKEKVKQMDVS